MVGVRCTTRGGGLEWVLKWTMHKTPTVFACMYGNILHSACVIGILCLVQQMLFMFWPPWGLAANSSNGEHQEKHHYQDRRHGDGYHSKGVGPKGTRAVFLGDLDIINPVVEGAEGILVRLTY